MSRFFTKFLIFFLLGSACVGLTQKRVALAQEQFETQYNIVYNVQPSGEAQITQNIVIINKQKDVLVTNYILTVKQMEIYDVTASDKKDRLDVDIKSQDNETVVKVMLKNQAIGEGKKNEIKLAYKSKQIAGKIGEIWNINIPPVETSQSTSVYNVELNVPAEFGPKIFVSPTPNTEKDHYFKFDKDSINGKSISASYGKYQVVNFSLKYDLKNNLWLPVFQEIALPPQIFDRQQILYKSLNPKPHHMRTDADGNILAVYRLNPKQELNITLVGSARLLGTQIDPQKSGKMAELSPKLIKDYTQAQKYWKVNAPEIQNLAKELFDPNKTVAQNAQTAYDYITKNLRYNFDIIKEDFVERQGALTALTNPTGSWACMEFTDLFIALTRAMGIPARELDGYAFSTAENITPLSINLKNGDLLHAWPEFYDPVYGWTAVDPTWGSTSGIDYFTKLDTSHFVFSVKGLNSEYPFPAGAYRFDNSGKQVEVDFAQDGAFGDEFRDGIKVEKMININPYYIFKGYQKYKITNLGGTILYNLNGTKKTLLPFDSESIYISKQMQKINYKDFNDNEKDFVFRASAV